MDMQERVLRKLAGGRINDAVALAFSSGMSTEQIEQLDLTNVAELTHDRNKGITTLKFFDRYEALERLRSRERGRDASNLYEALYAGAAAIREEREAAE